MFSRLRSNDDGSQEKLLRLNTASQRIRGQWRSMWRVTAPIKRSDCVGRSEKVFCRAGKSCQSCSSSLNPWPEIGPRFLGPKVFNLGRSFSPAKRARCGSANAHVRQQDDSGEGGGRSSSGAVSGAKLHAVWVDGFGGNVCIPQPMARSVSARTRWKPHHNPTQAPLSERLGFPWLAAAG